MRRITKHLIAAICTALLAVTIVTNSAGDETHMLSVTPTKGLSFGKVPVGSYAYRHFTVQNMTAGTLSGTARVAFQRGPILGKPFSVEPFSIVSGGDYSLGPHASQVVTLRFSPAASQKYSQNVTFTGGTGAVRSDERAALAGCPSRFVPRSSVPSCS